MSILVFAPHPDDEVLGCGGSIAGHTDAGRPVRVVFLSSGEHGVADHHGQGAIAAREKEARRAADVLGVPQENVLFLRLPDGGLNPVQANQFHTVLRLLRELRPTVVYLPHHGDGSFDHRQARRLVWRGLEMSGSRNYPALGKPYWVPVVLGYEVWQPLARPSLMVDIDAVAERKEQALACYRSQDKGAGQADHTAAGALAMARWRGAATIGGCREAFAVERISAAAVAW